MEKFKIPPKNKTALTIKKPNDVHLEQGFRRLGQDRVSASAVIAKGDEIASPSLNEPKISNDQNPGQVINRLSSNRENVNLRHFTVSEPRPSLNSIDISNDVTSPTRLDIYARKYVPYWLQAVNKSHAIPIYAPQLQHIDFDHYRRDFVGRRYLEELPPFDLPPNPPAVRLSELSIEENYAQYWRERLQNEFAAQNLQNECFALFSVDVHPHDFTQRLYKVKIPGVREYAPWINLGDILLVRPLVPVTEGTIGKDAQLWSRKRDRLAPGFSGQEHHAVVWSVLRRDEIVIIRVGQELPRYQQCNVLIPLQAQKCAPAWQAVTLTSNVFASSLTGKDWLRRMLFPEPADCVWQTTLSRGSFTLDWLDNSLNFEQKRAVQAVIDAAYGQIPYLISGPPGTGKTKTIVETVLQLLRAPRRSGAAHLLVCAPSDAAADTLLVRLSAHLRPGNLLRLNSWTRLTSEVPGEVRPYCFIDSNNLHSLPDFEALMAAQIVVTNCRDANMLIAASLTNSSLSQLSQRLLYAVRKTRLPSENLLHWTALLVDEAAQATEPEVLIPLSVVVPPHADPEFAARLPQVIMAGDEFQLGPRLTSLTLARKSGTFNTQGLGISLFQRLFERPLYKDHPLSRVRGLRRLSKNVLPIIRPPFTNLIRNYRSHPAILTTSSSLFYSDTLIPERPEVDPAILSWPCWTKSSGSVWPVMFHCNNSPDSVDSVLEGDGTGAGSLKNQIEADIALEKVRSLLVHVGTTGQIQDEPLLQKDVIVMSPFRAQVNYLRQIFRVNGLHDVRIGPLEAFQGLESRVVVLCTTRTRHGNFAEGKMDKFVREDQTRNLGVIDAPKDFNVAMTRAMEGLIVIGSADTLCSTGDRCWVNFIKFCTRNGLCTGFPCGSLDERGVKVVEGNLEKALNYVDKKQAPQRQINGYGVSGLSDGDDGVGAGQDFRFRLHGTMVDLDQQMLEEMRVGDEDELLIRQQEDEDDAAHNGFEYEADEDGHK